MHLLASGDQYKFRAFQVRAKFVLWAALSPKVGLWEAISALDIDPGNTNPFSADEVAIYRGILERCNSNSRGLLNVSNRTFPIDRDLSDCGCLKGIEPQTIVSAAHSFRILTGDVLGGNNIRLVDANKQAVIVQSNDPNNSIREGKSVKTAVNRAFSTGLFSMSEIAFDKEQQRALVSYSFVCGSLCGSGGVWLFEKVDGAWKKSEHVCGGWIS
jgi:hypothetical protein